MKRTLLYLAIAAAAALVLFAAFTVKRVPAGSEALRVSGDGDITEYAPGFHVVLPGYTNYIVYPTGEHTYRCPRDGTYEVLSQEGEPIAVAFTVTVVVPPGSAKRLYGQFSEDFDAALERVVNASAEMEAATTARHGDRGRYLDAVTGSVREQLDEVGVEVSSLVLDTWGGRPVAELPDDVEVSASPPRRLVIVGVDGGDWLNIEPLVDAGKLPNFKKLIERGATGPLRSEEPMLSPLLWTTMATGKNPEEHGILNFTVTDPETGAKAPITRRYRKVDAFWNMIGDFGRKVCVVGWLATDPAESVNGVMVTDRVGYLAYAPKKGGDSLQAETVYPPSRAREIERLVDHADDVTYKEMQPFVHVSREEFLAHRDAEFDPKDALGGLIRLYATTKTYTDIALHLLESDHPDLLAVYFELVDATGHLFMLQSPPRMPDVPPEEYAKYKDAVAQSYVEQDEIIGDIMSALDDNTVLMVISDHGFKSGSSRLKNRPEIWAGHAAQWHRINGIIALYGAGVKKGFEINGASILDVTPTILALQGLPRASDMPGKVLAQAFEPDLQAQFSGDVVATLERERADEAAPAVPGGAASEEAMKKLEALGYVTPDNADAHNNLGQRYEKKGQYLEAIEEYKKAIAMRPDFHSAYNNLAVCYGKLKRYDEAEAALKKTIELKPDDYFAMNNLAVMSLEQRRFDQALEYAKRTVETEPGYVNGHVTLGSALAMTGDLDGAEKEFRKALELDPESRSARTNLERLERRRGGN
jgi:predicted AlkP superfamily phosphohydrolase/phosphomutase/Flp pilus assembly protein TadD